MSRASATAARPVFLAPHYDDVALSCGGTVALLAERGVTPLVVTVFGGEPAPATLTEFARWQHARWGTGEQDTLAVRRAEERAAATILGYETRWLEYQDAIYRGERYLSDEALFGPLAADEAPLVDAVAATLAAVPEVEAGGALYVPLAAGNHVDHQVVYLVGRRLAARGARVLAYEDFPYAALDDALARRLATVSAELGAPELVAIAATLPRRLAAIAAYHSQLAVIFRFWADMPSAVEDYVRRVGEGTPAERYWPLVPGGV